MKTINLTSLEKSDIKYTIQNFPDGQKNIVLNSFYNETDGLDEWSEHVSKSSIKIISRLNNMEDFGLIACTVASLRELGVETIHLYVPYFMGARSDRKFEEGGNWYLRDVICPMINALNFKSVEVLDPHSYVLGNLIKGFKSKTNLELVIWTIKQLYDSGKPYVDDCVLISPDAGASHKIYKLAERLDYRNDIITCSKERAADGKLTRCVVPGLVEIFTEDSRKDFIIIDDICDGGATFINIAKVIKARQKLATDNEWKVGKIYLIVTHGIFSKGIVELSDYFDGVYCTNSYSDYKPISGMDNKHMSILKQLNVF